MKPLEVLLVRRADWFRRFLYLLEVSKRARPVLLPPGFEFIRTVGLPAPIQNSHSRIERRDQQSVTVFPEAEAAETFA